jgi:hypothetical protein
MVPDAPGIWLYHYHISDHMLGDVRPLAGDAALGVQGFAKRP